MLNENQRIKLLINLLHLYDGPCFEGMRQLLKSETSDEGLNKG